MHICLIAEGSYPYITGGVSSWISQLITHMPETKFSMIAINPDKSKKGQYVYQIPPNLLSVEDIFLDDIFSANGHWNKKIPQTQAEAGLLIDLIQGRTDNWHELFYYFKKLQNSGIRPMDLLLSEVFFDCVRKAYLRSLDHLPFAPVYWTMRSMYLIIFALLMNPYPKADLYHAVSTGYAGFIGARAGSLQHAPFLLTEHGLYTREREEEIIMANWLDTSLKPLWIRYFSSLSHCAYDCSAAVISLFHKNLELQQELGCPAEKLQIIHNGIDADAFAGIAKQVSLRRHPEQINIGAVIRVVPIKDIKTMIQAFSIAEKRLTQASFSIMGPIEEDPEYYEECLQYLHTLKCERVVLTGRVDIRQKLPDIDLLVLTSISEGQPLAILEGLACSIPFVSTAVGDCVSLLTGENDTFGPAGLVAPVMNASVIADHIVTLSTQHQLRRQMGENGLNRVRNRYAFSSFINGYAKLYHDLTK